MLVDTVEGNNHATSVGLSDGDFKNQGGDAEEDEGDKVGDKPLEAIVGKDNRGVSQEVAETDGAALEVKLAI